jgi:hypothetical protein
MAHRLPICDGTKRTQAEPKGRVGEEREVMRAWMSFVTKEPNMECNRRRDGRSCASRSRCCCCCLLLTIVPRGKELQHCLVEQMVQMSRDEMVEAVQRVPAVEMIDAAKTTKQP